MVSVLFSRLFERGKRIYKSITSTTLNQQHSARVRQLKRTERQLKQHLRAPTLRLPEGIINWKQLKQIPLESTLSSDKGVLKSTTQTT